MRSARASGWLRRRPMASAEPRMIPACGPPSSLSPLKVTRSTPRRSDSRAAGSSANSGRSARAPLPRSSMTSAPRSWAKPHELLDARLRREAHDAVVAGVHPQHRPRALAPGALDVAQVRAVGGADLDQPGAALGEDVGNAKAVADLDELAPRDDHLAVAAGGGQGEQDGGGVVVDDQGVGGAGQGAQHVAHVALPRGALAASPGRARGRCTSPPPWRRRRAPRAAAPSGRGWCGRPRRWR